MTSGSVAVIRYHGSNRSLVRLIASKLPIDPGQRLLVQLPHGSSSVPSSPLHSLTGHLDSPGDGLTLASFLRDPGPLLNKAAKRLHSIAEEVPDRDIVAEGGGVDESGINMELEDDEEVSDQGADGHPSEQPNEATAKKISALESELARLKAQIASYALSEMQQNVRDPVAPPAPPPPPLRVISDKPSFLSVSDRSSTPAHPTSAPPASMSSVLQGLGSVKLKAVEKSPGGTPMRKKPMVQDPLVDDPAAIIASALRKKFSHRVFQDSPDKENLNRSESSFAEFNSPTVKLF